MKKIALLLILAVNGHATPYFRILDLKQPQINAGALIDVQDPSNTSATTSIALITHSPKDGCYLPSIACTSWSPLAVGFSGNSGRFLFSAGPSVNLAPVTRALISRAIALVTKSEDYVGLKTTLSNEPHSETDISIAFGPWYVVSPTEKFKGSLRIFSGVAWNF